MPNSGQLEVSLACGCLFEFVFVYVFSQEASQKVEVLLHVVLRYVFNSTRIGICKN